MKTRFSWHDLTDKRKQAVLIALGTIGLTLGIILSIAMRTAGEQVKPVISKPVSTPRPSDAAKKVVEEHLKWAEVQTEAKLSPQLKSVREFFAAARLRTRAYGEIVIGWDSKWTLAADAVSGRNDHAAFLEEQFSETLFSQVELDQLVQQTVQAYLREIDDCENQMLVKMQADLERLPAAALPPVIDQTALKDTLQHAMQHAASAARTEFQAAIGRELVAWGTSEIVTVAGIQLATSAGILGTGAATSVGTLGLTLVLGVIIDAIVQEVYNSTVDPVGKLAALLDAQLTQMETQILRGTDQSPGLESRLKDYTARRNAARRQAVQHALLAP